MFLVFRSKHLSSRQRRYTWTYFKTLTTFHECMEILVELFFLGSVLTPMLAAVEVLAIIEK